MCLAVPGKVVDISGEGDLRMGRIDFGGVKRQACLAYLPEAQVGDYVLVHVGFAISRIEERAARETLQTLTEVSGLTTEELVRNESGPEEVSDAPR